MVVDRPLVLEFFAPNGPADKTHIGLRYRPARGNCYAAAEALYHILGGRRGGWMPMRIPRFLDGKDRGDSHWFLKHKTGLIIDPSRKQFKKLPPYERGIGCGFLTQKPSRKAKALIAQLTWQEA